MPHTVPRRDGLIAVFCALVLPIAAFAQSCGASTEEPIRRGLELLHAGLYQHALLVAGGWSDRLSADLLQRATACTTAGQLAEARSLYEAYLKHFPAGYLNWSNQRNEWNRAAVAYVKLFSEVDSPEPRLAQNTGALPLYQELCLAKTRPDSNRSADIVETILTRYPLSLFAPAAAIELSLHNQGNHAKGAAVVENAFERLTDAGAAPRGRMLLLIRLAQCLINTGDPAQRLKGLNTYIEVSQQTEIEYERRAMLLAAGNAASRGGRQKYQSLGQQWFRDFLTRYPRDVQAENAALGLIRSHLWSEDARAAEEACEEIQRRFPTFNLEFRRVLIARQYIAQRAFDDALRLLDELDEGSEATAAYLQLASVYRELSDETRMVAAYEKAAGLPVSYTLEDIRDPRRIGVAYEQLADYHLGQQNWQRAWEFLTAWSPGSGCATCLGEIEAARRQKVAIAEIQLGRPAAAARLWLTCLVQESLFQIPNSNGAVVLFRLYRDAGQLDDLRRIMVRAERICFDRRQAAGGNLNLIGRDLFKSLPTWALRETLRVEKLAAKKDYWSLVRLCRADKYHQGFDRRREWLPAAVADALARCGPPAVEIIEMALAENDRGRWLLYALGASSTPESLLPLIRLARDRDSIYQFAAIESLAMKGPDVAATIEKIRAAEPDESRRRTIVEAAKRGRDDRGLWASWPRPKAGSLPSKLDREILKQAAKSLF